MADKRLIDADALYERIEKNSYQLADVVNTHARGMFIYGIKQAIDETQTVDAVPVVRCKDCECGKFISDTKGCVWCTCYEIYKSLYGFCNYGKREEGEHDE